MIKFGSSLAATVVALSLAACDSSDAPASPSAPDSAESGLSDRMTQASAAGSTCTDAELDAKFDALRRFRRSPQPGDVATGMGLMGDRVFIASAGERALNRIEPLLQEAPPSIPREDLLGILGHMHHPRVIPLLAALPLTELTKPETLSVLNACSGNPSRESLALLDRLVIAPDDQLSRDFAAKVRTSVETRLTAAK